jgi:hypothetical protein
VTTKRIRSDSTSNTMSVISPNVPPDPARCSPSPTGPGQICSALNQPHGLRNQLKDHLFTKKVFEVFAFGVAVATKNCLTTQTCLVLSDSLLRAQLTERSRASVTHAV